MRGPLPSWSLPQQVTVSQPSCPQQVGQNAATAPIHLGLYRSTVHRIQHETLESADFSSDSLELAAFNYDSLEQAALSCDSLDWNSSLLTRQYIDIWSWRGVIWQLPRTMQQQNILQSHLTKIYWTTQFRYYTEYTIIHYTIHPNNTLQSHNRSSRVEYIVYIISVRTSYTTS